MERFDSGGDGTTVWLWIPFVPAAKKSSKRILKLGNGRSIIASSSKAIRDERAVRSAFLVSTAVHVSASLGNLHREWWFKLWLYRRSPKSRTAKARNPRRGDPASAHELIIDAMQGVLWLDDEQVTEFRGVTEVRHCPMDGILCYGGARQLPSDYRQIVKEIAT